jgi:hypothetical protein
VALVDYASPRDRIEQNPHSQPEEHQQTRTQIEESLTKSQCPFNPLVTLKDVTKGKINLPRFIGQPVVSVLGVILSVLLHHGLLPLSF